MAYKTIAVGHLAIPALNVSVVGFEPTFSCVQDRQINQTFPHAVDWRKRWDSNPRDAYTSSGFQDQRHRPLGHSSILERVTRIELVLLRAWKARRMPYAYPEFCCWLPDKDSNLDFLTQTQTSCR
jgi:hypothetical protein